MYILFEPQNYALTAKEQNAIEKKILKI